MSNVPSTNVLSDEDRLAALREAGLIEPASGGSTINRLTMKSGVFYIGDDVLAVADPKGKKPAFIAQLKDAPFEFQAAWFTEAQAIAAGRPNIADKFCKSHFLVEKEKRDYAEDGTACETCPINPFTKVDELPEWADGKKCQWRGDLEFKIVERDDQGVYGIEDDTLYTMTLPPTGMIDFKGTSRQPVKGSVSERNFTQQLVDLAIDKWGADQPILKMNHALRHGAVVAEVRAIAAKNDTGSRSWHVIQLTPVHILDIEEPAAALPDSDDGDAEDVPF